MSFDFDFIDFLNDESGNADVPRDIDVLRSTTDQQNVWLLPLPLSPSMQAVHDEALRKLRTLQAATSVTECRFALLDGFLTSLQSEMYKRDTKVFVCSTHARGSVAHACTYGLASVNKAKRHAILAAANAAKVDDATGSADAGSERKKRHRASLACDACRVGKRRCDRAKGTTACNYCASHSMPCVWSGDNDNDNENENDAHAQEPPVHEPVVMSDSLLEQLGHSDDVAAYAAVKMPAGVPQALLLPIRSATVFARRGLSMEGPTLVNMNDEFVALTGLSRADLQFSPVSVVLAPLNAASVVQSLGNIQTLMSIALGKQLVKMPMRVALSVGGTWRSAELTATVVFRNRFPTLVYVTVDRVSMDQQLVEPPIDGVSTELVEPILKHRQFVMDLISRIHQ
jgi:hypothetical protein